METDVLKKTFCCLCMVFTFTTTAIPLENPIEDVPDILHWKVDDTIYSDSLLVADIYIPSRTGWCSDGNVTNDGDRKGGRSLCNASVGIGHFLHLN